MSNKITNCNDFIPTKHKGNLVENEEELLELFNFFFENTIENSIILAPTSLGQWFNPQNELWILKSSSDFTNKTDL